MMTKHSPLGPSAAHRWLRCAGSIEAEKPYPDVTSSFAQEGTNAHDLAAFALQTNRSASDSWDHCFGYDEPDNEMIQNVQEYVDYVRELKKQGSFLLVEETLRINLSIEEIPGTADAVIIDPVNKIIHVCDLKYGKGIRVVAYENEQLQLYAIGVLALPLVQMSGIYNVCLHIIQPRLRNFTKWQTDKRNLMSFFEKCQKAARKTVVSDAERTPGDIQCKFCKAKADCSALYNYVQRNLLHDFQCNDNDIKNLSDFEKSEILKTKNIYLSFIKAVEDSVMQTIEGGGHVPGWKIVEGRSKRQWKDNANQKLEDEIGEAAWRKQLITITEASKILSKECMDSLTIKPVGKPVLVPDSDKRISIHDELKQEFQEEKSGGIFPENI